MPFIPQVLIIDKEISVADLHNLSYKPYVRCYDHFIP